MKRELKIAVFSFIILISFHSIQLKASLLLEAEDASLTGVSVATTINGYSGTGYVTDFDQEGDNVIFNFSVTEGMYKIEIGYGIPSGEKGYDIIVNGMKSSGMFTEGPGNFKELSAGKYYLQEGENTVIIGGGWNWYNIDFIRISETNVYKPLLPEAGLSDPSAPLYTQRLYYWLRYIYGKKVISGQQGFDEINYIKNVTGQSPAIGGFDLIEYSPSRIEHGSSPWGSSESWIDWQQEGEGILTLMWHWNAPTDLIDDAENPWWSGFYARATTFNFAEALADPSSDNYQLLLRDIDSIASQLKKFQDAEIPVLWRPLHEASGGWFWWGTQGAESYVELWQLMYDRLTQFHDIHNLIWVYTAGDPTWYPGDEFVDIVSLDIYTDPSSPMSGEWESIQELFNGRKLVTLSETGTILQPNNVRAYATWWSYFCIWNGSYLYNIPDETLISVYSDEDIITLDELPIWEELDMEVLSADELKMESLRVYPVPAQSVIMVEFPFSDDTEYRLELLDLQGKKFQEISLPGIISGSIYSLNINNLPSGIYILSIANPDKTEVKLIQKN
jgi:mannan endo-1,4-beta-mannosidase